MNNDEEQVLISESELRSQTHQHDLHPLVFIRVTKSLKDGARLPSIDLKKIYPVSTKFGFKCEVIPDTSYIINDVLIGHTKTAFQEIEETYAKFPVEGDKELLYFMNKQLIALNKEIKDVDPKADFNVSDMAFKNEKLKKVPESAKKLRIQLLWAFNKSFVNMFPYLPNNPVKPV